MAAAGAHAARPSDARAPPHDRPVLWAHLPPLALFGVLRGDSVAHVALDTSPVLALAILAGWSRVSLRGRMAAASLGLTACSALLVHLWDGPSRRTSTSS